MQENFSSQTLAEIFRDLYVGERSGVLNVSHGNVEKRIYFDRGMILFAESGADDEDLGRRLVNEGKISPGALAEARQRHNQHAWLLAPLALIPAALFANRPRYAVLPALNRRTGWYHAGA